MPQMSPMLWTTILMTTTIMVIQLSSMNFFESIKMNPSNKNKKNKKKINWKW
uniref:ATP synthase F0 subunit 8 n=1 Tax=Diostrombus politus TaxID=130564 RepID=UPI002A83611B|nr:ATP synthase F0 subunit 8 [Diostrombus politus]WOW99038.1 ATP synthase F0 subunit 8 [Diostrombus politus]